MALGLVYYSYLQWWAYTIVSKHDIILIHFSIACFLPSHIYLSCIHDSDLPIILGVIFLNTMPINVESNSSNENSNVIKVKSG